MDTNIPNDLLYTKTHEWIRKKNGGMATMGITDYAQQHLKDIVFVELPPVGKETKAGTPCAVVESVKAAYDIFAPASGKITESNLKVTNNPQLVNEDPYGEGWFSVIALANPGELNNLLTPEQYRVHCESGL